MTKKHMPPRSTCPRASWADNAGYEASPISFSGMHRKSETYDEDPEYIWKGEQKWKIEAIPAPIPDPTSIQNWLRESIRTGSPIIQKASINW